MSRFIELDNQEKLCPKCGSLGRTRRLWSLLEDSIQAKRILHFSPSLSLKTKLESIEDIKYVTTDYAGEFKASKRLNIESIDEPDECYDLVICYHVLEHIEDDVKAMTELKRVLRPNGLCIIQTPFKTGEIYENDKVKTDEERLIHFGQKDHLRIYSVDGLMNRLQSVGFQTKLNFFEEDQNNYNGFNISEQVIMAEKPISTN